MVWGLGKEGGLGFEAYRTCPGALSKLARLAVPWAAILRKHLNFLF